MRTQTPRFWRNAIQCIAGLDRSRLLVFGGWESASRGASVTMQLVGEQLGILDQFQGVDQFTVQADGSFEVLERIEGGRHLVSVCPGPPALLGWATGNLPEPRNNPQMGMANMRTVMPALQRAKSVRCRLVDCTSEREPAETAAPDARGERPVSGADRAEIVEWIGK